MSSTEVCEADKHIAESTAETLLNTEETEQKPVEVPVADAIDILFGGLDIERTKHLYGDGVTVEILNLSNDEGSTTVDELCSYNGSRVFYKLEEGNKKTVLCRFPGYNIDKYLVATDDELVTTTETNDAIEEVLANSPEDGAICLTNDGPLIMVFKVAGKIRIHMMRTAASGFDEQFATEFSSQYDGHKFEDLFPANLETSSNCFLFRQGSRSSAMNAPMDGEWHTMLYLGTHQCDITGSKSAVATSSEVAGDIVATAAAVAEPLLSLGCSILTNEMAVEFLRNPELGLVCYRHPKGEVQIMSESYLRRVATMTGISVDDLLGVVDEHPEDEPVHHKVFNNRATMLMEGRLSARLASSRFPRLLDLFSLFVLCGTNSKKRLITVNGFSVRLNTDGRILAAPRQGFYNFCRAAGVNPRRELSFPATPRSIRLAIRRIILSSALPSKISEMEQQFNNYETALFEITPSLIARVMSGSAALASAFERAFGSNVHDLIGNLPTEREGSGYSLRSVRSSLLLADPYRLVTVSRFSLRYLINLDVTVQSMRERQLVDILTDFSNSSRRRRAVAAGFDQ
jgi:hypothetical protein